MLTHKCVGCGTSLMTVQLYKPTDMLCLYCKESLAGLVTEATEADMESIDSKLTDAWSDWLSLTALEPYYARRGY